jgi:hypothetical protein
VSVDAAENFWLNCRTGEKFRDIVFWDVSREALVIIDVLEELSATIIRVPKIVEIEPHGVSSQKTAFFIVTAVKTSNLTGEKLH